MRALSWASLGRGRAAPLCSLALALAVCLEVAAQPSPPREGLSSLDPAFRLAAGGLALAGPILDARSAPAAVWLLSEDLSLYALTDAGGLSARIGVPDGPLPLIALDPFGRVIVLTRGGTALSAYTRMGSAAWRAAMQPVAGPASLYPPAFGSDGRAFALSGKSLVCLNPQGARLWTLPLPAAASCPPGVDGRGRPCVGLADGRLLVASPYGEILLTLALGGAPSVLLPMPEGDLSGAGARPVLAAGLADGNLLLLGADGRVLADYRSGAAAASLAWDGSLVYGLDASGEAFALEPGGRRRWTAGTGCSRGRLYLFADRLVAVGKGRAVSLSLDGEVYRELAIPGASGTPAISPAGFAYSSGADWILAAYRFERPLGKPRVLPLPPYPAPRDAAARILLFDPFAADPDDQLQRLASIENSLRSGTMGKDEPEDAAYCAAVAGRALERNLSEEERRLGGSSLARSRACYLLGGLGSPAYRGVLFQALESDADPAVRASACEALAQLGVDPDGASMAAFLAAAGRPVDERTAVVIASAIEAMTLGSGRAPSEAGIRALVRLAAAPYSQAVRKRAMDALGRIAGVFQ